MESAESNACPICGRACHHQNHLRGHIHEHHRKSVVIDAYLRAVEPDSPVPVPVPVEESSRRPLVRRTKPRAP